MGTEKDPDISCLLGLWALEHKQDAQVSHSWCETQEGWVSVEKRSEWENLENNLLQLIYHGAGSWRREEGEVELKL